MQIILFQPQIPQNTGNIVRTCSVIGASLRLVPPLGFSISSRHLKRSGLDYWEGVDVALLEDLEAYLENKELDFYFFSSKAKKNYTDVKYTKNSLLIFGSETTGLPPVFHERWPEQFVTLPMKQGSRCLNLSNSVAVASYEVLRQNAFQFE